MNHSGVLIYSLAPPTTDGTTDRIQQARTKWERRGNENIPKWVSQEKKKNHNSRDNRKVGANGTSEKSLVNNQWVQLLFLHQTIKTQSFIRAFQHIRCFMITHLSGLMISMKRQGRLYGGFWKDTEVEGLYLKTALHMKRDTAICQYFVTSCPRCSIIKSRKRHASDHISFFDIRVIQSFSSPLCIELIKKTCSELWLKVLCYTQNDVFHYKRKKKSLKT